MKLMYYIFIVLCIIGLVQVFSFSKTDRQTIFVHESVLNNSDVIVFLHGSPGSHTDFDKMIPFFENYTVITLDFPGFGGNALIVDNYGTRAAADYLAQQFDLLNISSAHIMGYSWGGGVAQQFAAHYPGRTKTVIFYASMGFLDAEPTKSYLGEQIRYYISYPFVVWYPGSLVMQTFQRHGFMRSFMDTDLRETPELLSRISAPVLLVHGVNDTVVPPWTAKRFHLLLSNSTLVYIPGGHGQLFSNPFRIAETMRSFLDE